MREINIATIDEHALELAQKYDLGIELDQFCTGMYMDMPEFEIWNKDARRFLGRANVLHGPFNEISPCAIDPKIRVISMERYNQAYEIMRGYGIKKIVLHGGFVPLVYFPVWYIEQSIIFWKEFLKDKPSDFTLLIENVMEPEPQILRDIVEGIGDDRCKMCFDAGHANAGQVSNVPILEWMECVLPCLGHLHLHNNDGTWDWHKNFYEGNVPIKEIFEMIEGRKDIGITIENIDDTERSIFWMKENGII